MKKYILLLVFVMINIGYTQTLKPKTELYNSLMYGIEMRSKLDFFKFLRPIAFVPLTPDTVLKDISSLFIVYNDVRTDYPYDYYEQVQLPSKSRRKNLNRYIENVGFIWKINSEWVWVVEVRLHFTGYGGGVKAIKYSRSAFENLITKSITYDKPKNKIENK